MNRGKAALVTAIVTLLLAAFALMLARRNTITEVKAVAHSFKHEGGKSGLAP
jgi:hypothetical protein